MSAPFCFGFKPRLSETVEKWSILFRMKHLNQKINQRSQSQKTHSCAFFTESKNSFYPSYCFLDGSKLSGCVALNGPVPVQSLKLSNIWLIGQLKLSKLYGCSGGLVASMVCTWLKGTWLSSCNHQNLPLWNCLVSVHSSKNYLSYSDLSAYFHEVIIFNFPWLY